MKKIKFMDCSFRDGFQSCLGARVKTDDFLPALEAAVKAGINYIEIGGGARFQSLYFYCQEDAFEMMDRCREVVGPEVNLQTLARGVNVVGLSSQPSDIIDPQLRRAQRRAQPDRLRQIHHPVRPQAPGDRHHDGAGAEPP